MARLLLALFCAVQGASTALIDLNRTHATHPGWMGHARFHLVWQTSTIVALSLFEIALLLTPGPFLEKRFYVSAILAAVPMLGFFAALAFRKLYGGTLSDPLGMPQWVMRLRGVHLRIDLNLAAEIAAILSLAVIIAIYRAH